LPSGSTIATSSNGRRTSDCSAPVTRTESSISGGRSGCSVSRRSAERRRARFSLEAPARKVPRHRLSLRLGSHDTSGGSDVGFVEMGSPGQRRQDGARPLSRGLCLFRGRECRSGQVPFGGGFRRRLNPVL
jgi:hypothetical protein